MFCGHGDSFPVTLPQLNNPASIAFITIRSATMDVIKNGLFAINFSGPGMVLKKKEAFAILNTKIIQNSAALPPYTHQQKIP